MKKIVILIFCTFQFSALHATHFFRNNAANINSGILPNVRLDPSSVTLLGNTNIDFSSGVASDFTANRATFPFITAVNKIGLGTVQYTPPIADGTNGQILATNGTGGLSWILTGAAATRGFEGIVIGTEGATNVDTVVNSSQAWTLTLSSSGNAGLTQSTTAQRVTFILKNGVYINSITTIPANVAVICQSSVVFPVTYASQRVLTVFGRIGVDWQGNQYPCSIDGGGYAFSNNLVTLTTGSQSNLILYGMKSRASGGRMVDVLDSTGVIAALNFKDFITIAGVTNGGDRNGFRAQSSSNCIFTVISGSYVSVNVNAGLLQIHDMWDSKFIFNAEMGAVSYTNIQGGGRNTFLGDITVPPGAGGGNNGANYGIISFDGDSSFGGSSTGTYCAVNFHANSTGDIAFNRLRNSGNTNAIIFGGTITNGTSDNTHIGLAIQNTSSKNCGTNGLLMWGIKTGVSDAGTNSTLHHCLNGVCTNTN